MISSEKNNNLLITASILMLMVSAFLFFTKTPRQDSEAYRFTGFLSERDGSVLEVYGGYLVDGKPEFLKQDAQFTAKVKVTDDTEIVLYRVFLPKDEDLGEDGSYSASDLEREAVNISLTDLDDFVDRGLTVETEQNIYNRDEFTAEKIELTTPVYPDER